MQVFLSPRGGGDIQSNMNASGSMSNRQRVAKAAAAQITQFNDSAGSLRSENSKESGMAGNRRNRGSGEKTRARRSSKDRVVRRQRSVSPDMDEEDTTTIATAPSKSTSTRSHRESRGSGRSGHRHSSRSRSKSRGPRSKSANARNNRLRKPSRNSSGDSNVRGKDASEEMDYNNSTCFIPPISPGVVSPRDSSPTAHSQMMSPPLSGRSETSKVSLSEMELMDFLETSAGVLPTNSQRLARSVPFFQSDDNSGRASRTVGKPRGGSTRRERSTGVNKARSNDRVTSIREGSVVTSSSQYKRPPRNARGVGRSQSASAQASLDVAALLSPRKTETSLGSRQMKEDPTRGVRRAKSTDDMGDLTCFFNHNGAVSRRKKPNSGSKSVASMPSRPRRNANRIKTDTDSADSIKPPSSRSTVTSTASPYDSDDGDESIDESLEDLNDTKEHHAISNRSVESTSDTGNGSYSSATSFTNMSMEAALQMHMSRTENLLFDVFPKHIAEALRSGRKVEPENHECVTIFFSDIVGFTEISSELDPMKISDLLDRLYNSFDALSHYHDVFKVETIGDAYVSKDNSDIQDVMQKQVICALTVLMLLVLDGCDKSYQTATRSLQTNRRIRHRCYPRCQSDVGRQGKPDKGVRQYSRWLSLWPCC